MVDDKNKQQKHKGEKGGQAGRKDRGEKEREDQDQDMDMNDWATDEDKM